MKNRRMRFLREKHGIPLLELSRYSDASQQRLAQIELGTGSATGHMNRLVETAFARLVATKRRELAALEEDLQKHGKQLLDFVDELEGDA